MLGEPHVESFDFMTKSLQAKNLATTRFSLNEGKDKLEFSLSNFKIEKPALSSTSKLKYPKECRLLGETYRGKASVTVDWAVNGEAKPQFDLKMGEIPIMVWLY